MKNSNFFLLALIFFSFSIEAQNSLADIIGDVSLPHEGKPHGVPEHWDWACAPRAGLAAPPENWTAAIAWGQLYEWKEGNPATNTRVQIKDLEMYYLSKTDSNWHLLQEALLVEGAAYREDFANDENKPADQRLEPDGSLSVTAGNGYNFHFWPNSGRTEFPVNDVLGCFVTVKARLIVDKPAELDDRSAARYLMGVGGDWWESLNSVWDNWTTNADMGIGRFRFVSSEWKSYNMISIPLDMVERFPPPFISIPTHSPEQKHPHIELRAPYPNPSVDKVSLSYELPMSSFVEIDLLVPAGQKVRKLFAGQQQAGFHQFSWDVSNYAAGMYYLRYRVGQQIRVQKLIKAPGL